MHLDGTSFHVHGEYNNPSLLGEIETKNLTQTAVPRDKADKEQAEIITEITAQVVEATSGNQSKSEEIKDIHITYGYSRDKRPDLKQYLMNIMSSSDGDVPLFLHIGDGNEAEKSRFPTLIKEFKNQWTFEKIEVFVADSALYSEENIKTLGDLPWISRVPLTLKEAKQLVETLSLSDAPTQLTGYTIAEVRKNYGGVEQRWLVIESQERKEADLKQLSKQLDKQQKIQQNALQKLSRQEFNCEADAIFAAEQLAKKMKYHHLENIQIVKQAHYDQSGRPSKDKQPSRLTYHVQTNLVFNTEICDYFPE